MICIAKEAQLLGSDAELIGDLQQAKHVLQGAKIDEISPVATTAKFSRRKGSIGRIRLGIGPGTKRPK